MHVDEAVDRLKEVITRLNSVPTPGGLILQVMPAWFYVLRSFCIPHLPRRPVRRFLTVWQSSDEEVKV